MTVTIKPRDWKPLDGFELERTALEVVRGEGNFCVIAGPGAGKTELLAQKVSYLLQTQLCVPPRRILALSYKKDAEKNLKDRVARRVGKELASRFISLTYDAFAKQILDHFLPALSEPYSPNPNYEIAMNITEIFTEMMRRPLSPTEKGDLFERFVQEIKSLPLNERGKEKIAGTNIEEKQVWLKMIRGTGSEKVSKLTFPVITVLTEYIIRTNPNLWKALCLTYSHILLDEFQDTTKANYALIKTCFLDSGCAVTAVGDDKQRIMLWAGANKEIFNDFERDFQAVRKTLVTNFRSAPRLITLQRRIAALMGKDDHEVIANPKWKEDDGVCELFLFNGPEQEAEVIGHKIASFIEAEGLKPRDICFLVRQRPPDYAKYLINQLKALGIETRNETEYQDLLSEQLIFLLLNLILISFGKREADAYRSCVDLLGILSGKSGNYDSEEEDREIENKLSELRKNVNTLISQVTDKASLEETINRIIDQIGRNNIRLIFPQYKKGEYLQEVVSKFSDLLWREIQGGTDWENAVRRVKGENAIPFMTIHKSKGLEYHTVIFIGLEDSAFWKYKDQTEEEVSTFFVAMSRAKQRLVFTFSDLRNNRQNTRNSIQSLYDLLKTSGIVVEFDCR